MLAMLKIFHKTCLLLRIILSLSIVSFSASGQVCSCSNPGTELVINGDFAQGNTGFTTSYTFAATAFNGRYGITVNANNANPAYWSQCKDHTTGSTNFMWVDASPTSSLNMWTQVIPSIKPNTNYLFSCWLNTLDVQGPATLQFSIDSQLVGSNFTAPSTTCNWVQFCTLWNSGNKTSATITIVNQSKYVAGNDVGIDDISFRECCSSLPMHFPGDTICNGDSTQLGIAGGAGYSWLPTVGLSNAGISNPVAFPAVTTTYTVTITSACGIMQDSLTVWVMPAGTPATVTALADTLCEGTPINLNLAGTPSGPFQWQSDTSLINFTDIPGATNNSYSSPPLFQTTYFRVLTGAGNCMATSTVYPVKVVASPYGIYTYTINGKQVTFNSSGSSNDVTYYSWDFGDGGKSSLSNPSHTYNTLDSFTVCLTVYNGSNCSYTYCSTVKLLITDIELPGFSSGNIFPNPFVNDLYIKANELETPNTQIEIYDLLGRKVFEEWNQGGSTIHLHTTNLPDGTYFLRLHDGAETYNYRVIKSRH